MFPLHPVPSTAGALWFTVSSTTEQFPTDGAGGSTTTETLSTVRDKRLCVIEGYILQTHDATSNLILTDGSDNTIETFTTAGSAEVGKFVPFGIEGLDRPGPFGVKLAAGSGEFLVFYRILMGAPET